MGAVTSVETEDGGAVEEPDTKAVHLDRPFVYLIVDCEAGLPIFVLVVMEMGDNGS